MAALFMSSQFYCNSTDKTKNIIILLTILFLELDLELENDKLTRERKQVVCSRWKESHVWYSSEGSFGRKILEKI